MSSATTPVTTEVSAVDRRHLRRLRWAVRAVLALGVAASIAANVLHARPNPISQVISAWPPLALMLTVELISRVPTHQRVLAVLRLVAAAPIAVIAAWVSYWHMAGVAARYGETEAAAAYLLPLSVDGLVVVASVSLVEITGRLRATRPRPAAAPGPAVAGHQSRPGNATPDVPLPAETESEAASGGTALHLATPVIPGRTQGSQPVAPVAVAAHTRRLPESPPATTHSRQQPYRNGTHTGDDRRAAPADDDRTNAEAVGQRGSGQVSGHHPADAHPGLHPIAAGVTDSAAQTPGQPLVDSTDAQHRPGEDAVPTDTAAAVAYWHGRDPTLHPSEIAARIGRSERTVRRYWPPRPHSSGPQVNGPLAGSHSR
ncbi:DUF2637 domain-containing protein [Micromonospora sp. L32]|uniref:DUF2637 domain-containing protein n=1 Tax=Micromonospora sp. L32 TaxID=3452214 RepID=UPI003F890CB5